MNCEQVKEQLALWTGGDLDPASAQALDHHLANCAACQLAAENWREDLQKIGDELANEEYSGPTDADLNKAVTLAVKQRHQPTTGSRWWSDRWPGRWSGKWTGAVAALLAFLILGYFLRDSIPHLPGSVPANEPESVAWSQLQDYFDDCLSEPVAVSRWQGQSEPGLLTVLVRSRENDRYRVVECVAASDLAGLRSYPWLDQRLRKLEAQAGGKELLVTTCATGNLDGANRRKIRQEFLREFKSGDDS